MKRIKHLIDKFLFATAAFIAPSCNSPNLNQMEGTMEDQKRIIVFAAAGLSQPLNELIDSFELAHAIKIQINYASSGTLARQITQQETPDIFISASKKWMDYIDSLGYIKEGFRDEVVKDKLVLIAPKNSQLDSLSINKETALAQLLGTGRLSMGDPAHVPAGEYAKQALDYFALFETIEKQILPAKDVRSAVMAVEMAEAPMGIAYYTVARQSDKIKILSIIPESAHKPIVFSMGICKKSKASMAFFEYVNLPANNRVWEKYGFTKP